MIVLSGASLVLPDRILTPGTLVIDGARIADIRPDAAEASGAFAFHGHYIVPGFIDVHVHGVDGIDAFDTGDAIDLIAARLPRYGVTAFCPTTVACTAPALRGVLDQVRAARTARRPGAARVLPAHLESNFIAPEYAGAQPVGCLRHPRAALDEWSGGRIQAGGAGRAGGTGGTGGAGGERLRPSPFDFIQGSAEQRRRARAADMDIQGAGSEESRAGGAGGDILHEIERSAPDVGIVTLAPELAGALDLVAWLTQRGHRVSLGHSAATYDEALAAIAAGARHATHLFNRMPPLSHRAPGLAGAVLQAEEVAAEIICDGFHVHPAVVRTALAAKGPSRVFAITDGTAVSGLPVGATATLGGRTLTAGADAAYLSDGTIAGSTLTMEGAFRTLVERMGVSLVDAAILCATTPARELSLVGHGVLAPDAAADVVVLDASLTVIQTYIAGQLAYSRVSQS